MPTIEEKTFKEILSNCELAEKVFGVKADTHYETIERDSFSALLNDYKTVLYMTQAMADTLACMLATCVSTKLPGDQLWMRIIGPPGSGKSTLAEAISANKEYVYPISIFTGIHSGIDEKGSMIPRMQNKTTIIKDADSIMQRDNVETIMSELRDIYDRTSRAHYRNAEHRDYENINATFLLCGTDHLRTIDDTHLGERFLDCEVLDNNFNRDKHLSFVYKSAVANVSLGIGAKNFSERDVQSEKLKRCTAGYLEYLQQSVSQVNPAVISAVFCERLQSLCKLIAIVRTKIPTDRSNTPLFRPRGEIPSRLIGQFVKLTLSLCLVFQKKEADQKIYSIVRKIALDTMDTRGYNFQLLNLLSKEKQTTRELALEVNLSDTATRRKLISLNQIGAVEKAKIQNPVGQSGRQRDHWSLSPEIHQLWKSSKLCLN